MTYTQTLGISRVRDSSTWISVAFVIALHALILVWLLTLRWSEPLRHAVADMVLVELRATAEPALGEKTRAIVAPNATPNPSTGHAHAASAAPRRESVPADLENRVIRVEGTVAPGSAVASLAPSNPHDGIASGLGASQGGVAAPGGDGAHARGRFRPPEVTKRWRPDYPLDAFQARKQGSVDVMVTIGTDSTVKDAHVFQSSGTESLDLAAVEAVKHYVFRAARRGPDIVEAQAIVTIDWVILASGVSTTQSSPQKPR